MILELALVTGASALTSGWHHWRYRNREVRNHRAMCNHVWGENGEVGHPPPIGPQFRMYMKHCVACGEQKHTNADGSDYIPTKDRP